MIFGSQPSMAIFQKGIREGLARTPRKHNGKTVIVLTCYTQ